MRFKDVENNSTIREIGPLFCRLGGSGWHINVKLKPSQKKQYFGISQIPVLARRRVLNPTAESLPAGFLTSISIEDTRTWKSGLIKSCPISAVNSREDANQWCFVFEHNETQYFLPQLELARVLFFHYAYLVRLSLVHQGLIQDFDVRRIDGVSKVLVDIMPTSSLPLYVRGDHALRRVLAWILLDDDARRSFESIARHQLQDGYDIEKYRVWCFQFDPPLLQGAGLTFRGHYDRNKKSFFVYEVYGISNLLCNCPSVVDFFDPRFFESQSGGSRAVRPRALSITELEIDEKQEPDSDRYEIRIDTPMVAFEFSKPFHTTRIGKGRARSGSCSKNGGSTNPSTEAALEISTDEASVLGTLPSADFDGLDDKSDDAHLYAHKFEAFEEMVVKLVNLAKCDHIRRQIRKLPWIEGYSKHLLPDGSPRCLAFHLISKDGAVYALLEVETSDNKNRLSTLFLKEQASSFDWERQIGVLEIQLLKSSLVWPTSFLTKEFGSNYKRIPHPKTSSSNKALIEQESINHWAERVHSEMLSAPVQTGVR